MGAFAFTRIPIDPALRAEPQTIFLAKNEGGSDENQLFSNGVPHVQLVPGRIERANLPVVLLRELILHLPNEAQRLTKEVLHGLEAPTTLSGHRRTDHTASHDLPSRRGGHGEGDLNRPAQMKVRTRPDRIVLADNLMDLNGAASVQIDEANPEHKPRKIDDN